MFIIKKKQKFVKHKKYIFKVDKLNESDKIKLISKKSKLFTKFKGVMVTD